MSLRQCIDFIRQHEKELALFNVRPDDPIDRQLASYFETQNVRITTERTASGAPENVAVLSSREAVLAVVSVSMLRELLAEGPASRGLGVADAAYEPILGPLKETTFTSTDTEQMLSASREIEDRARRVGSGTIHAGFQHLSTMHTQRAIYADLVRVGVS